MPESSLVATPSKYQTAVDQAHAFLHRGGDKTIGPEIVRWMVSELVVMTPDALQDLAEYLIIHEPAIAQPVVGQEILVLLRNVFKAVMGREPKA